MPLNEWQKQAKSSIFTICLFNALWAIIRQACEMRDSHRHYRVTSKHTCWIVRVLCHRIPFTHLQSHKTSTRLFLFFCFASRHFSFCCSSCFLSFIYGEVSHNVFFWWIFILFFFVAGFCFVLLVEVNFLSYLCWCLLFVLLLLSAMHCDEPIV